MITDTIITIFTTLIQTLFYGLLAFGPATLPTWLNDIQNYVNALLLQLDSLFPVYVLLLCFGFVILLEAGIFLFKTVYFLIKKIPTIS